MKVLYKNYQIEIIDDTDYSTQASDNIRKYNFEYSQGKPNKERIYPTSKHGIIIHNQETSEEISSAIICESGGATTIHSKSFNIRNNRVWLCICDKIYCLKLPYLDIEWFNRLDFATNFSIHFFQNDFIIHSELYIFRITQQGKIVWQFGGKDIFVTQRGKDNFWIENDRIYVRDWDDDLFTLDANGNEIKNI